MEDMNEHTTPVKILVVDDEPNIVELLNVSLKFQGFEVVSANLCFGLGMTDVRQKAKRK